MGTTTGGTAMSNEEFLKEAEALVRSLAFSNESRESLKRVEHICTAHPQVMQQGVSRYAFQHHERRLSMCFYTDDAGRIYAPVRFNSSAEGPPGFAHGGAIATSFDTALALLAAHNSDRICLTKDLTIFYESAVKLGEVFLVRCWISSLKGEQLSVEGDLVTSQRLRLARGKATMFKFPMERAGNAKLPSTVEAEAMLLPLQLEFEREQDRHSTSRNNPPQITFPDPSGTLDRFKEWERFSYASEFPGLCEGDHPAFYGQSQGRHFEFSEFGGTMLLRRFKSPEGKMAGAVYFSQYSEGPPQIVHGGAIATACDAFLADAVYFLDEIVSLTKSLSIKYIRSISVNSVAYFTPFETTKVSNRSFFARSSLVNDKGQVYALCMAEFSPRPRAGSRIPITFPQMRDLVGRTSGLSLEQNREVLLRMVKEAAQQQRT